MKPKIYISKTVDAHGFLLDVLTMHGVFDPVFCYGENGKPYLKNNKLYFNLSHCEDMVVCAVADHEVGVDIEKIQHRERVARRVCNERELESIRCDEDFTRIWVLKESFAKCDGRGISMGLKNIDTTRLKDAETWRVGDFLVAACYNGE